jgi:hypothetical protein
LALGVKLSRGKIGPKGLNCPPGVKLAPREEVCSQVRSLYLEEKLTLMKIKDYPYGG